MPADPKLIAMLKRHEGTKLRVYLDTVGKLTIGTGRNIEDVGISEDEAELMLSNDIKRAEDGLRQVYPWFANLDEVRQAALIDAAFNLGLSGLSKFHNMLGAIALGNWEAAANEALNSRWHSQVGNRAKELAEMIRTGEWADGI